MSGAEKLKPRFYGPYKVLKRIGEVAYELELPEGRKIQNVFNVSCPKKIPSQHTIASFKLPPLDEEGKLVLVPEGIADWRERRLRNKVVREYLIKWKNLPLEDAT